jgi:hypothetical protein
LSRRIGQISYCSCVRHIFIILPAITWRSHRRHVQIAALFNWSMCSYSSLWIGEIDFGAHLCMCSCAMCLRSMWLLISYIVFLLLALCIYYGRNRYMGAKIRPGSIFCVRFFW